MPGAVVMSIPQARLDTLTRKARDANTSALVIFQAGQPLIDAIMDGVGNDRVLSLLAP
jgi:hypothetical protein